MDSTGRRIPKFVKILSSEDCRLNEMVVPRVYCNQYGDALPNTFRLKLRTGYEFWVDFDKKRHQIKSLSLFFKHFDLKGGQSLVFEYCGGYNFNVYILGDDFSEIEYPNIVHHFQTCSLVPVRIVEGGWKFAKFMTHSERVYDSVVPPTSFLQKFAEIPKRENFVVNNGEKFVGNYNSNNQTVNGLERLCKMFGVSSLNCFSVLLFTYDGGHVFQTDIFDERMIEILFPYRGLRESNRIIDDSNVGANSGLVGENVKFEITVKPFHMYEYYHGVDIGVEFKELCEVWGRKDYIKVYQGERCWPLEIRKRKDWKRTTIHDGWIELRDDLELKVGDVCIFTWKDESCRKFTVEVHNSNYACMCF